MKTLLFILFPLFSFAQFKPYIEVIGGDSVAHILYSDLVNVNVNFKELKTECNLSTDNLMNRLRTLESKDSACSLLISNYELQVEDCKKIRVDLQTIIFNKNSTLAQYDESLKACEKGKKYWERKYDRTMTTITFGGIGVTVVIILLLLN